MRRAQNNCLFVSVVRKLLQNTKLKGKHLLSERFNQDPMENLFGVPPTGADAMFTVLLVFSGEWGKHCQTTTETDCDEICDSGFLANLYVHYSILYVCQA